jgi:hypothetical protein
VDRLQHADIMSNAGPLTTTFTAPSSCTTAIGLYQIWPPGTDRYHYEQGPLYSRKDCFPSGYDASPWQYYSPGLCPSGYTPACSSTEIISRGAAEIAHTCCPTAAAYTCAGLLGGVSTSGAYLGCTTTFDGAIVLAHITAISDGKHIRDQVGDGGLRNRNRCKQRGGAVQIRGLPGPRCHNSECTTSGQTRTCLADEATQVTLT